MQKTSLVNIAIEISLLCFLFDFIAFLSFVRIFRDLLSHSQVLKARSFSQSNRHSSMYMETVQFYQG